MPSNQLPEDVRERAERVVVKRLCSQTPACKEHRDDAREVVSAIAPLLIEWSRKDALLSAADDMPAGGMTSQYWDGERVEYATYEVYPRKKGPADWLRERAQFTPETTGGKTPSDHDELLARTATHRSDGVGGGVALIRELETALRTEQSARQAAEAQRDAGLETEKSTNATARKLLREVRGERDALQARIDAALAAVRSCDVESHESLQADLAERVIAALTTESKEPAPKLDPKPMLTPSRTMPHAYDPMCDRGVPCQFAPRPGFSQNPADYGIEVPHE